MTKMQKPIFLTLLALSIGLPSAFAQLPPTNMGKFVHQPGDNQYSVGTQGERHGGGYYDTNGGPHVMVGPPAGAAPPAPKYSLAPPPPKGPDVSIEPIAAEEPIAMPGFPPLPMTLDLPVSPTVMSSAGGSWRNSSGGSGGGGGGGGGSGGGPGGPTGMHQHYAHYQPGQFQRPANGGGEGGGGGGGGGGEDPGYGTPAAPSSAMAPATPPSSGGGGSGNYYKVRTPPPVMRQESFSTSTGGTTGKGAMSAPTNVGSRDGGGGGGRLGKAPTLDDSQDAGAGGAPEAPTATGVFQSTSNDLTLPDDDYTSRYFKDGKQSKTGRYAKQMAKRGRSFGKQMLRQTGVPIGF